MIARTMWFHRLAKMPLRLPLLFALLTLVPAAALGWLTFELVRTDRELERERVRERAQAAAERAADRIVAASHQRLTDLERLLGPPGTLPTDVVRVEVDDDRIRPLNLGAEDQRALVAFLQSLSGRVEESFR